LFRKLFRQESEDGSKAAGLQEARSRDIYLFTIFIPYSKFETHSPFTKWRLF
jgi:hypothetical protein